jgi:hypothetical protein
VAQRANHKLAFKFFGPFEVIGRVGQVAYKLDLPSTSRVHPVFHVSQLKPCVGPGTLVSANLPPAEDVFQIPVQVLRRRVVQQAHRTIAQGLIQWSGMPEDQATWEALDELRQCFPHAPAWGQAGFKGEGIVNDPAPPGTNTDKEREAQSQDPKETRPRRVKRRPAWMAKGD